MFTYQTIDGDIPRLTNTMTPILSLFIHCRIPVCIIEDDIAGTSQIETDATTACGGDEAEYTWIVVESLNQLLT